MKKGLSILCALAVSLMLASSAFAGMVGSFSVTDAEGKAFTQDKLKGNKSVIIFLQAACGQCRGEVAEVKVKGEEIAKKAKLYFMIVDVNVERATDYFTKQNLPGTLLFDPNFDAGGAMDVSATPSTVVIDKDLNILKTKVGYKNGDLARLIPEL